MGSYVKNQSVENWKSKQDVKTQKLEEGIKDIKDRWKKVADTSKASIDSSIDRLKNLDKKLQIAKGKTNVRFLSSQKCSGIEPGVT